MPTFTPFRTINLFRSPATKQSVNFYGSSAGLGQPLVTTSSLDEAKKSVPFWWLLHKLTFSVSWSVSIVQPEGSVFNSGSFTVDFIVNESPNDKICRTYLDPIFVNLIEAGPIVENTNLTEVFWTGNYNAYYAVFNIEPFKCDFVHAAFFVFADAVLRSTNMIWYITSGPKINLDDQGGQAGHILEEEINITLPNNETASLFMYCMFFNAGYGPAATALTTMQLDSIEWWELA